MKKRTLALLLALVMLLGLLAACGGGKDADQTEPAKTEDVTAPAKEEPEQTEQPAQETPAAAADDDVVGTWECDMNFGDLFTQIMASQGQPYTFSTAMVKMTLTLDEKGGYAMTADEDDMRDAMRVMAKDMLLAIAEENGTTLDEMLAEKGMSNADFEAYLDEQAAQQPLDDYNKSGTYEFKDGKLFMDGEDSHLSLSGDTLSLSENIQGVKFEMTYRRV